MPPPNLKILGIDPGESTGWAYLVIPRKSVYGDEPGAILQWDQGQLYGSEEDQTKEICRMVRQFQSLDFGVGPAVVVEDFDIAAKNPTTDPVLLTPVRLAAMLRYARYRGEMGPDSLVMLQGRTIAMSTATDERLRAWRLYVRGEEHARDAMRHAIVALRRASQKTHVREAMWADPNRPNAGRVVREIVSDFLQE